MTHLDPDPQRPSPDGPLLKLWHAVVLVIGLIVVGYIFRDFRP